MRRGRITSIFFLEGNKMEFGSDFEGISALGVGQDRYL